MNDLQKTHILILVALFLVAVSGVNSYIKEFKEDNSVKVEWIDLDKKRCLSLNDQRIEAESRSDYMAAHIIIDQMYARDCDLKLNE